MISNILALKATIRSTIDSLKNHNHGITKKGKVYSNVDIPTLEWFEEALDDIVSANDIPLTPYQINTLDGETNVYYFSSLHGGIASTNIENVRSYPNTKVFLKATSCRNWADKMMGRVYDVY